MCVTDETMQKTNTTEEIRVRGNKRNNLKVRQNGLYRFEKDDPTIQIMALNQLTSQVKDTYIRDTEKGTGNAANQERKAGT